NAAPSHRVTLEFAESRRKVPLINTAAQTLRRRAACLVAALAAECLRSSVDERHLSSRLCEL
ncbi:hypothetical protein C6A85_15420, partial [Mycobacterium sp. ITM-2017-0098]